MDDKVFAQLDSIRQSGLTNMFDGGSVLQIANKRGYYDLVMAIVDDRGRVDGKAYMSLLDDYEEWLE